MTGQQSQTVPKWTGMKRTWPGGAAMLLLPVMVMTTGCITVKAPDKPIEIVLNINIRQEVVYRLDSDAKKLIEQNTEIF